MSGSSRCAASPSEQYVTQLFAAQAQHHVLLLLLPVYTSYIQPSGYGIVETPATVVIFVSIVVRFGIIEAFLRFYFADEDQARRDALARRAVVFLAVTSTVAAVALALPARPLSALVLGHPYPTDYRIAVFGMWAFTNLELAYALLRVDERLRAYATASLTNVGITISDLARARRRRSTSTRRAS